MGVITMQVQDDLIFEGGIFIYKGPSGNKGFKPNVIKRCSVITTGLGVGENEISLAIYFGNEILILPLHHKAYQVVYETLSTLLKLDDKEYVKATISTENAEFILWEAPDDLIRLIPIDKFDVSGIDELKLIEVSKVAPILSALLEWIQDLNWPVARELIEVLPRFHAGLIPHIVDVFRSDDSGWKYWTLELVKKFPTESIEILMPEIKRIAEFPSRYETLEGIAEKAQELING